MPVLLPPLVDATPPPGAPIDRMKEATPPPPPAFALAASSRLDSRARRLRLRAATTKKAQHPMPSKRATITPPMAAPMPLPPETGVDPPDATAAASHPGDGVPDMLVVMVALPAVVSTAPVNVGQFDSDCETVTVALVTLPVGLAVGAAEPLSEGEEEEVAAAVYEPLGVSVIVALDEGVSEGVTLELGVTLGVRDPESLLEGVRGAESEADRLVLTVAEGVIDALGLQEFETEPDEDRDWLCEGDAVEEGDTPGGRDRVIDPVLDPVLVSLTLAVLLPELDEEAVDVAVIVLVCVPLIVPVRDDVGLRVAVGDTVGLRVRVFDVEGVLDLVLVVDGVPVRVFVCVAVDDRVRVGVGVAEVDAVQLGEGVAPRSTYTKLCTSWWLKSPPVPAVTPMLA